MDFYLTINSRLVGEKRWYKDINRLPYGNLTGKNESMKRHQKTHNSPERSLYATVVFCGMYPVSLAEEKKNVVSLLSFCSYQVDDTLNFPADKNFVQLQSVLPRSMRLKVPRCRIVWLAVLFTVPLPGIGSRARECEKETGTAGIVHLQWSERVGVSLSVPF